MRWSQILLIPLLSIFISQSLQSCKASPCLSNDKEVEFATQTTNYSGGGVEEQIIDFEEINFLQKRQPARYEGAPTEGIHHSLTETPKKPGIMSRISNTLFGKKTKQSSGPAPHVHISTSNRISGVPSEALYAQAQQQAAAGHSAGGAAIQKSKGGFFSGRKKP